MGEVLASSMAFLRDVFSYLVSTVVVGLLVLLIGIIIAKILERVVFRVLHELELNKLLHALKLNVLAEEFISMLVRYTIYFIAVVLALERVGLAQWAFNLLALVFIGLILALLLLSVKEFIPNVLAGMALHHRGFVKVGDKVGVAGVRGKVVYLSLTEARIRARNGDLFSVPNSLIIRSVVRKK